MEWVLLFLTLTIAFCAAVDNYATVLTSLRPEDEKNPVGRYILKRWGVKGLVGVKTFTTSAVVCGLWMGFGYHQEAVLVIAGPVATAMVWVVWYLWKYS